MLPLASIVRYLRELAPLDLAEEWDNVGLLVGDPNRPVARVMTCLTLTPTSVAEALAETADLVVSHHPLPFRPLSRLTTETTPGRLLLELAAARVAVYSPHTAWDSAAEGINQQLACGLGLRGIAPLLPHAEGRGAGRWGWLEEPVALDQLAGRVKRLLSLAGTHVVGSAEQNVRTVALGCGAADELLAAARHAGCDAMVIGEARFHTCLEAEASHIGLVLAGHYGSERPGTERLAQLLATQFPALEVWPSRNERDPLRWV
jgi:dinuclear metal center YbgI/SA1388 family protein